ncbi:hypothetical protein FIBSPDRAFT_941418 [Athelia psychrophila]|uniref:Uncharacterized protein n=1 Tax=Athelia psychrophila TaxID=1759441 RepID=A0A167U691_9AGAM|nr:hypothetical protein FIBSPDRAFT_941418 [Fibularhizoctonia sp. CBS 109695]
MHVLLHLRMPTMLVDIASDRKVWGFVLWAAIVSMMVAGGGRRKEKKRRKIEELGRERKEEDGELKGNRVYYDQPPPSIVLLPTLAKSPAKQDFSVAHRGWSRLRCRIAYKRVHPSSPCMGVEILRSQIRAEDKNNRMRNQKLGAGSSMASAFKCFSCMTPDNTGMWMQDCSVTSHQGRLTGDR